MSDEFPNYFDKKWFRDKMREVIRDYREGRIKKDPLVDEEDIIRVQQQLALYEEFGEVPRKPRMEFPHNWPGLPAKKQSYSMVPPIAITSLAEALEDGANKYGCMDWRNTGIAAEDYADRIQRHLLAWRSGEDRAPDSKVHHMAHIMADAAILIDAESKGVINDDRKK